MADTELTSAVYEVLGTIYAILLAFVVSGIWQNYKAAVASVQDESDALLGIVYILGACPTEQTKGICSMALDYAKVVIDEWQTLASPFQPRSHRPPQLSAPGETVLTRNESGFESCSRVGGIENNKYAVVPGFKHGTAYPDGLDFASLSVD